MHGPSQANPNYSLSTLKVGWALFGYSLENPRMNFDRPLGVSNKISLQNQLQDPYARNPEESNETFDRVIIGQLL